MPRIAQVTIILAILAMLAIPGHLATASAGPSYVAIDVGTLGGPSSYLDLPGQPINSRGVVVGQSCVTPDCSEILAFSWHDGALTQLPSPEGIADGAFAVNAAGLIAGGTTINVVDPVNGGLESRAVLWKDGKVLNLGTPSGGTQSQAFGMNDRGQITGPWSNDVSDPYSCQFFNCWGLQTRGFFWQNGAMQDMGTLGGPGTLPLFINNRGQVAGHSYTNATPNATTGQPTQDPFLWENGKMQDLGTLGGALGDVSALNSQGEVAGFSDLAGDQTWHAFLWSNGTMRDLGTLGGDTSEALWMNNAGEVVGRADLAGSQTHDGFLWKDGKMTDLIPVGGATCSNAFGINDLGQAVGTATDCHGDVLAAVLWQNGTAYNLNTLTAPSGLTGIEPAYIDNRGEVVCWQFNADGTTHVVVLIPSGLAASEGITPRASSAPATAIRSSVQRSRAIPTGLFGATRSRSFPWSQVDTR